MRKDPIERLDDIVERIADVFLTESDPDNWNGSGVALRDMDEKTRGNRYWDKKNAIQTGSLLWRGIELKERQLGVSPNHVVPLTDDDADKEIRRYEKKAKELIDAIQTGSAGKR